MLPDLLTRVADGHEMPFLLCRFDPPRIAIASGPLGGGIGERTWALIATVPFSDERDDPDNHLVNAVLAGNHAQDGHRVDGVRYVRRVG